LPRVPPMPAIRTSSAPTRTPPPDDPSDRARPRAGETLGGILEVVVTGLPIGLGSYVNWDRRSTRASPAPSLA
jgi:hypothetical protein